MHIHQRAGLYKEHSGVGSTLVRLSPRSAERHVNISQKMGHIIYRKAASSTSLTALTLHSMLRIEGLFIGLDHMPCKPGAVRQGRCGGKKQPPGKGYTCNSQSRECAKGQGGLQLLLLSNSSFFKRQWFLSS